MDKRSPTEHVALAYLMLGWSPPHPQLPEAAGATWGEIDISREMVGVWPGNRLRLCFLAQEDPRILGRSANLTVRLKAEGHVELVAPSARARSSKPKHSSMEYLLESLEFWWGPVDSSGILWVTRLPEGTFSFGVGNLEIEAGEDSADGRRWRKASRRNIFLGTDLGDYFVLKPMRRRSASASLVQSRDDVCWLATTVNPHTADLSKFNDDLLALEFALGLRFGPLDFAGIAPDLTAVGRWRPGRPGGNTVTPFFTSYMSQAAWAECLIPRLRSAIGYRIRGVLSKFLQAGETHDLEAMYWAACQGIQLIARHHSPPRELATTEFWTSFIKQSQEELEGAGGAELVEFLATPPISTNLASVSAAASQLGLSAQASIQAINNLPVSIWSLDQPIPRADSSLPESEARLRTVTTLRCFLLAMVARWVAFPGELPPQAGAFIQEPEGQVSHRMHEIKFTIAAPRAFDALSMPDLPDHPLVPALLSFAAELSETTGHRLGTFVFSRRPFGVDQDAPDTLELLAFVRGNPASRATLFLLQVKDSALEPIQPAGDRLEAEEGLRRFLEGSLERPELHRQLQQLLVVAEIQRQEADALRAEEEATPEWHSLPREHF